MKMFLLIILMAIQTPVFAAEISPYFYTWGLGKYNSLSQARQIMGLSNATYAFVVSNGSCAVQSDIYDAMGDVRA